jgi:hypothetical protein
MDRRHAILDDGPGFVHDEQCTETG